MTCPCLTSRPASFLVLATLLAGCGGQTLPEPPTVDAQPATVHAARHAGDDDLLTAGLGLAGLRQAAPPAPLDPLAPTAVELRRRAIWANWRGIADLAPGGGMDDDAGRFDAVPGSEHQAFLTLPGARHPHRVMVQVPDAFDARARCLVVAASSGSRGIYGAISLAGGWGLPRGCAVAYTDKGAGTGWFDLASGRGAQIDGAPGTHGEGLDFDPGPASGANRVAVKHFHSGDNPEADWGRHVRQTAEFGLRILSEQRPDEAPFDFGNTRVIALGVSNGAAAVLRAAELEGDWLDGVVAVSPNILPGEGGRALFDMGTEAALLMPCALAAPFFDEEPLARPGGAVPPAWRAQCAALHAAGGLTADGFPAQAEEALERLRASGWTDRAIAVGALSAGLDLWRVLGASYASAYARTPAEAMPCGYGFAALGPDGAPRSPEAAEQALWWSDTAGVPPGAGVGLVDGMAAGEVSSLPGLLCLRALWEEGEGEDARTLRASIEATRAGLPRPGLPVLLMHGVDDGLVPEAFSSGPYAAWVEGSGGSIAYWRLHHVQHFDAFLGLPPLAARFLPLMPYAWAGMDAMWSHLEDGTPLPASRDIHPTPRGPGQPLDPAALDLP